MLLLLKCYAYKNKIVFEHSQHYNLLCKQNSPCKVHFSSFSDLQSNEAKLRGRTTFFGFILTQIIAVVTLFLKLSFSKPKPDDTYNIYIYIRKNLLATHTHTNTTLKLFCQRRCVVISTWFARARKKRISISFFSDVRQIQHNYDVMFSISWNL